MLDKIQLWPNKSRVYKKRLTSLFRDESDLGNEPGSMPYKRKCLLIDTPDYDTDYALMECRVFKQYIQRLFPIPQELEGQLCYRIRGYRFDFGTKYKVSILYDDRNLDAFNFACNIELAEFPSDWDEIALKDLRSLRLSSALTNLG
ncbi:hypothetical protein [Nostoc sp. DedQUE07]|uniref:hypothetical protein n=1 Tax=Nostoc sp. DedQUE07 TaxID=3075392 RepID=UPI002AD49454|nr:hypothetical protein [Nostoc sp. DedQUE07]MDZ8131964.1 hypothetical protein [Nostoc sp. DedQUE07]